jgi:hypothetical protein
LCGDGDLLADGFAVLAKTVFRCIFLKIDSREMATCGHFAKTASKERAEEDRGSNSVPPEEAAENALEKTAISLQSAILWLPNGANKTRKCALVCQITVLEQ